MQQWMLPNHAGLAQVDQAATITRLHSGPARTFGGWVVNHVAPLISMLRLVLCLCCSLLLSVALGDSPV